MSSHGTLHPAVLGWHISNEYGGECHCHLCQARFRDWLKARYKTLDALNHAWWSTFWSHTYTDWLCRPPCSAGTRLRPTRSTSGYFCDIHAGRAPLGVARKI